MWSPKRGSTRVSSSLACREDANLWTVTNTLAYYNMELTTFNISLIFGVNARSLALTMKSNKGSTQVSSSLSHKYMARAEVK